MSLLNRFMLSEDGATAIEYALIAVLIAVGVVASAQALGTDIGNLFIGVSNKLANTVD